MKEKLGQINQKKIFFFGKSVTQREKRFQQQKIKKIEMTQTNTRTHKPLMTFHSSKSFLIEKTEFFLKKDYSGLTYSIQNLIS